MTWYPRAIHIGSVRLHNNAGMDYPICKMTKGPLDLDHSRLRIAKTNEVPTCKKCLAKKAKNRWL